MGWAAASHDVYLAAIRFFFRVSMGRPEVAGMLPRRKVCMRLPTVLSQAEVVALVEKTANPKHRAILETLYGTGLRVGELCQLRITDIDSKCMVIHIQQAKRGRAELPLRDSPASSIQRLPVGRQAMVRSRRRRLQVRTGRTRRFGRHTSRPAHSACVTMVHSRSVTLLSLPLRGWGSDAPGPRLTSGQPGRELGFQGVVCETAIGAPLRVTPRLRVANAY